MNDETNNQEPFNKVRKDILGEVSDENVSTQVAEEATDILPSIEVKSILPSKEVLI